MASFYAAPMEGVTGYVWRRAHRTVFGGADRYLIPFVSPNQNMTFQTKELRELSQGETDVIPQILTNRADHFIWAARELFAMGYDEVNFNLGCPSGTVVAKHKGSGLLRDPDALDAVLEAIFTALPDCRISVKTRIGLRDSSEWEGLLSVFSRYPFCALIVHPRVQAQMYRGAAQREAFQYTTQHTKLPLIYNGDVTDPSDEAFSYGCDVMVGRGLLRDGALFRRCRGGAAASREELISLHEMLLEGYAAYMQGDAQLLHRMWEHWHYLSGAFGQSDALQKRIVKARTLAEYRTAADAILRGCPIVL